MNDTNPPTGPVPGRECGACTLCCKTVEFSDFNKPAGKWCANAQPGRGCKIHDAKPAICSIFFCEWRGNPNLGPEWKPDRARFVLSTYPGTNSLAVWLDPGASGAWLQEPYYSQIKDWGRHALINGSQVMVINGNRVTVVLPTSNADVGVLKRGDRISVYENNGDYSVAVERAGEAG